MLEIRTAPEGRLQLVGRLDAAEAERLDGALKALGGPLTLDCSELDYISSAGLGVLIETHKRLAAQGHSLTLSNLVPRVRNIFAYAGLDRLLKIV
jgi:anti-sigma B factor antagonist